MSVQTSSLEYKSYLSFEIIRLIYLQGLLSNLTILFISPVFFYLLEGDINRSSLTVWIITISALAIYRIFLWSRFNRLSDKYSDKYWFVMYLIPTSLIGLAWGYVYSLGYGQENMTIVALIYMMCFGVIGAGIGVLSASVFMYFVYIFPQIVSISYVMVGFEGVQTEATILGISIYAIMMVLFSRNINHHIVQSIKFQYQLNSEIDKREDIISSRTKKLTEINEELKERDDYLSKEIIERKKSQTALIESEKRFARIAHATPIGIFQTDTHGKCIFINKGYQKIAKIEEKDAFGDGWANYIYPEDRQSVFDEWALSVEEKRPFVMNYRQAMPDNDFIWIHCHSNAELNSNGDIISYLGTIQDITEFYENKSALEESELRFRQIAENIGEVFWLSSPDWNEFYYVNPTYEKKWGQNIEALYDNPQLWMESIHSDDRPQVINDMPIDLSNVGSSIDFHEYRVVTPDGGIIWIKATAFPIKDSDGKVFRIAGIAEDITERKKSEEQIIYQAHYDSLTGLANRFLTFDRLSQLLNEAKRNNNIVALAFIDLDDFKKINDSLGHECGDKVLLEAGARLGSVVRTEDTLGRIGGDEFLMLFGGLSDSYSINNIIDKIKEAFLHPFLIEGREIVLTTSIGIALYPDDGKELTELLRNADLAMYHAKELGRNTHSFFTEELNKDNARKIELEEQMHGALSRNEFTVLFQPKISTESGRIIGAEALLRWHNPSLGSITPDEFIPIAEHTGMIIPIGEYVLKESLAVMARWISKFDCKLQIAVNLSPNQFRDPNLLLMIEQEIKHFNVPHECLELEITEGVFINKHMNIDGTLSILSKLGVNIAMDDFGTGYSSLNYLRSYPFNILKIDRSFVNDITTSPKGRELINAAIAMAHGLNLKVVAEGVETEEQLLFLKQLRCDYVQGYLLGKPMSEKEVNSLLSLQLA